MTDRLFMKKNKNSFVDIGILIAVTLIAYFPVSFFLFSLKNDSLVQYLPFRYHLSESIQHGYFPFWSPYLYTGFPVHADMQGMTWNPIVLIISLITRYNMSVLEFEVTIYLVFAAIGMYTLLKSFSLHRVICLVGGISYMSCGFINGSASVIPWISSAAFIPFVFIALKYLLERPSIKTSLLFGSALSLLFVCGYPTFFIYTSYLVIATIVAAMVFNRKNLREKINGKIAGLWLLGGLVFLLICAPAIISYIEFLPYYSRGAGITAAKAAENPFTLYSSLSFLLPNAVSKDHVWLNTDTSMRNSYVGIFVFALAALSLLFRKTNWQKLILGITVFSFLLSLGSVTPLHRICYQFLPGFNTFRHPGNIRLFTSIGIILLAAIFIQEFIFEKKYSRQHLISTLYVLTGILLLPVIYSLVFQRGIISNIADAVATKQPKAFLDELRFPSMLLIQSLLQLAFTASMIFLIRKKNINQRVITVLFAANSILFCWIALPFNFISQIRAKAVNQYVASFPDGYPLPDIKSSVETEIISDSTKFPVYGYPNFYSKKITIQDYIITPTMNKSYEEFNADKKLRAGLSGYPFVYLCDTMVTEVPDPLHKKFTYGCFNKNEPWKDSSNGSIILTDFTPNSFRFKVNSNQATMLTLFQQFNFNWKIYVNGNKQPVLRMNRAFMGAVVPAGMSDVRFEYRPGKVIIAAWVSIVVLISIFIYAIISFIRNRKPA